MPAYTAGLPEGSQVHVLNKRHVAHADRAPTRCTRAFHLANNPRQWFSDYMEFISAQLHAAPSPPKRVLLVGVSEGAVPAIRVARSRRDITHVAIIGDGGWTMRQSLTALAARGALPVSVEDGWLQIAADAQSTSKQWLGNPYRWWFDVMDLDPLADYLALTQPILVGFGELDESVPVESARFLENKFREVGKSNLTLVVYPGANHRLNAGSVSYRTEFFRAVSRWLD
ncbi:MAG: alpha/beta hydrolase family protein [Actinomycetota bacterium]